MRHFEDAALIGLILFTSGAALAQSDDDGTVAPSPDFPQQPPAPPPPKLYIRTPLGAAGGGTKGALNQKLDVHVADPTAVSPVALALQGKYEEAAAAGERLAAALKALAQGKKLEATNPDAARSYYRKAEGAPELADLAKHLRCETYHLGKRDREAAACFKSIGAAEGEAK